ncbi:MAG: hypothetical protein Q7S73_03220 [bacterium]|nr:hypothetical protein [bacterium]
MAKLRILIVSKDNGDTKMLLPIARDARKFGHQVIILAEGVGVDHYKKEDVKTTFSDIPNPDPETNFDSDFLLECFSPDVVLVGFPYPNHLSQEFGLAANRQNIPLVGVEDWWGGVKRNSNLRYSLVLTIDEYAADLVSGCLGSEVPVSVIGNHTIPNSDYHSPEAVLAGIKEIRSRFKEVFVYGGGGGKHTTEELKLLVSSLQKTAGNWCLIPRYHPNVKKMLAWEGGNKRTFAEVWDELLLPLGNRVVRLDAGNSDDMAVVCDAYFSSLGSSMSTAISFGKSTVAILPPATMDVMRDSKLEVIPAVYLGGAKTLTEVQDLRILLSYPSVETTKKFIALQPLKAIEAIEKLLLAAG